MTEAAATMTTPELKVLLVIPSRNNRPTLRSVAEGALAASPDVLVVDDGGEDGAVETIDGLPVEVLRFPENRGKGAAIMAAAAWAHGRRYTHIITLDADGQHAPAEVDRFLEAIQREPQAIVVSVRAFSREETPGASRFGRAFSNFWIKAACGKSVRDSQSGFRAYPVNVLRSLQLRGQRFDFEIEVLVRATWAGAPLEEVGVSVCYDEAAKRASHFRAFADNALISLMYTRLVARQLLPWPHRHLFVDPEEEAQRLSLRKPMHSLKILLRERLTPKEISQACMLGIIIATLPIFGLHSIAIVFAATRLRLNRLIAFNVQHICAPPFVPLLCIEVGHYLRFGNFLTEIVWSVEWFKDHFWGWMWEWLLGSLVIGPILALMVGGAAFLAARSIKARIDLKQEADEVG